MNDKLDPLIFSPDTRVTPSASESRLPSEPAPTTDWVVGPSTTPPPPNAPFSLSGVGMPVGIVRANTPRGILAPGSQFGVYRVGPCIGEGGMARVYQAEHAGLQRQVALKVLIDGVVGSGDESRERFLREARIAAAIKHPNVVNIFDVGVHDDTPFLVMELLAGTDLESLLAGKGPLDEGFVVDIMIPIVAGLAAVHDAGVVHRDLKPGNIFLSSGRYEEVEPKLLDFGISKAAGTEQLRHTANGLAEATLLAASEPPQQGPIVRHFSAQALEEDRVDDKDAADSGRARCLVSCGKPWPGTQIAIVDATSGAEVAPGHVGQIWIRGASVATGYWNREDETRATFDLTTTDGRTGFVRSGDLGVIVDGRLFVLGRQSDVLTIHGRTYYPHELETSSSTSDTAFIPHACAAVMVHENGVDKLVIIQEVSRTALRTLNGGAAAAAIRRVIAEHHRLEVQAVVLVRPATLLRTTSGKVRRASCREAFRAGTLAPVYSWFRPSTADISASAP